MMSRISSCCGGNASAARGEQPLRGRNEPVRIWARPDLSIEE